MISAILAAISVNSLISTLIYLVIVALILWCIMWFVGYVGVPEPFNKVIRVIVGLIALIVVIGLLLDLAGTPVLTR